MTRFFGPFRVCHAAVLLSVTISALVTGCTKPMTFPSASIVPTYNESPIQLTAGQFRPAVFVDQVQDNRPSSEVGSVGNVTFESTGDIQWFVKRELEGRLSGEGVPLALTLKDAQSQSHSYRRVVVSIRSANYGAATALLHRTVAGINLLVQVNDESGRTVFAQTYFGTAEKHPVRATSKRSGEIMAQAVQAATDKALRDLSFRAAVGL